MSFFESQAMSLIVVNDPIINGLNLLIEIVHNKLNKKNYNCLTYWLS